MILTEQAKALVTDYLDGKYSGKKSTKGFIRIDCPYCDGKGYGAIQEDSLSFHCFRCTPKAISAFRLIIDTEPGINSFYEALDFLGIPKSGIYDGVRIRRVKEDKAREIQPMELPMGFIPFSKSSIKTALGGIAYRKMKSRGFNLKKLKEHGVGYCDGGDYDGYVIFPWYFKGQLRFFQGRIFFGSGPKIKNPPEEIYNIGKSSLVYNMDALFLYEEVVIVESITNCLTLEENTIAIGGKVLSQKQFNVIISSPVDTLCIVLDPDAWNDAIAMASMLVQYKKIRLVKLPGTSEDDVNAIGKKITQQYIRKGKLFKSESELFKFKIHETTQYTPN